MVGVHSMYVCAWSKGSTQKNPLSYGEREESEGHVSANFGCKMKCSMNRSDFIFVIGMEYQSVINSS